MQKSWVTRVKAGLPSASREFLHSPAEIRSGYRQSRLTLTYAYRPRRLVSSFSGIFHGWMTVITSQTNVAVRKSHSPRPGMTSEALVRVYSCDVWFVIDALLTSFLFVIRSSSFVAYEATDAFLTSFLC
jgi:hypothetical protein